MSRNYEQRVATHRKPKTRWYDFVARSIIVAVAAGLAVACPAAGQGQELLTPEPAGPSAGGGGGVIRGGRSTPGCHNYQHDDGTMENSVGSADVLDGCFLVGYDALPGAVEIESISLAWGRSQAPANILDGTVAVLYVWDDPNDDGNPLDAVLLHAQSVIVQQAGTDAIVEYTLSNRVVVSGGFFVGASVHFPGDTWRACAGVDQQGSATHSWLFYDFENVNASNLADNDYPPTNLGLFQLVIRASGCPQKQVTYQGRLTESGVATNGTADLRFRVYSASDGGSQVGSTIEMSAVPVADGLFSVELNLSGIEFGGSGLWIEIDAAFPSGSAYSTLSPRQKITAAPHALFAARTGPHTHSASELPINLPTTDGANTWSGNNTFTSRPAFNGGTNGTDSPFTVDSSFRVSNLNVDYLDDLSSTAFGQVSGTNTWSGTNTYSTTPAFNGGTSGSTAPFSVDSTFRVSNLNADLLDGIDSAAFAQLTANNAFSGTTNTFSGSVGIGLTTPSVRLHVSGGTDAAVGGGGYLMTGSIAGNNIVMDDNEIMARANGVVAPLYLQAEGGDLIFGDETIGGFLGINTTSPAADLHVRGTDTTCEVRVTPNSADNTAQIRLAENTGATYGTILRHDGVGNRFDVIGLNNDLETPYLTVGRNSGFVGLGTTAPVARLHIADDSLWITGTDSGGLGASAGAGLRILNSATESSIYAYDYAASAARNLSIQNTGGGGKVGIARSPATNTLEVEGNASKTTSGSWLANSDRRIKRDIATIDGALETLDKLRLVSFRYTDDYRAAHPAIEDRDYVNVIAQEFAEVFPDWVKPSGEKLPDGGEILQVDTFPVTIYTAAAVQELHRQLQERDKKIASLEARLERLEAMLHPAHSGADRRP